MNLQSGIWLNELPVWSIERGTLVASSGLESDFWRETFDGFIRDDGHVLMFETAPSGRFRSG